ADPKLNDSVGDRFNMLANASKGMSILIKDYKQILKFDPNKQDKEWLVLKDFFEQQYGGFEGFNLKVVEDIQLEKERRERDHYELFADKKTIGIVLQNIISNAQEHGFISEDENYFIIVEIKDSAEDMRTVN